MTRHALLTCCCWLIAAQIASAEWSVFDPLTDPPTPAVTDSEWSRPIDAFVFAKLRDAGLSPAPSAGRRVWLRRVTYDLTGLPPTPAEIEKFLADERPDKEAFAAVVDRLLAAPQYGERWGRHWLDVVRYADSDGFAIDGERTSLWRFRDYVIRTFNEDRPFDQFIREQVAGDEIDAGEYGLVGVSFYRLGPWEADNMTAQRRRQDYLNDVTDGLGAAFLGLTIGCAKCHDHKYDPITQADYYKLQAFVAPIQHARIDAGFLPEEMKPDLKRRYEQAVGKRLGKINEIKNKIRGRIAKKKSVPAAEVSDADIDKAVKEKQDVVESGEADELKALMTSPDHLRPEWRFEAKATAINNPGDGKSLPDTFVLNNGDVFDPGEQVKASFPDVAKDWSVPWAERIAAAADAPSGRRRVLAEWLTSDANPLTPRVLANRIWQYHFHAGLVATANDFGANGSGVSHPHLLDYLARQLTTGGWRLKPLHREIVLSRTYRSSARHPEHQKCQDVDPDNRLLWRSTPRRLESETLRDAILAVSGRLRYEMGGPGFLEKLPAGMRTKYSFFEWEASPDELRLRRSIYMFQRRNLVHPMMEAFDVADLNLSCERRQQTITAPQALTLFNSEFAHENSLHMAQRLQGDGRDVPRQLELAYQTALGREPTADELSDCEAFIKSATERYSKREGVSEADRSLFALRDVCLVLINTTEFLYLD
ncbi:MAG: DUF1549 and DUF1553 domain-containing protein [Pirellulaceae bacterium]|nr:DUF1549 and DUF1553 domain-containing protein [Pirellulaceae bacterium]MDP7018228.1 DUF1549 and DUF1553 domain-containing protein [Pirellulaceae bacterium]